MKYQPVPVRDIEHILPAKDIFKHTCSTDCHCRPTERVYGNYIQVIHNAFDHREFVEPFMTVSRYRN